MFLLSKEKNAVINMQQSASVYVGADGCTLKVDFENGKGCQVGRYQSEGAAKTAIKMIAENIGRSDIYMVPDDDAVNAKIIIDKQIQHSVDGKKQKGHGGS